METHKHCTLCSPHARAFNHELALLKQRGIVNERRAWLSQMLEKQPQAPPHKHMQCEYIDLETEKKCKKRSIWRNLEHKPGQEHKISSLCKIHRDTVEDELKTLHASNIVNGRRAWIEATLAKNVSRFYSVGNPQTREEKLAAAIYWCKDCNQTLDWWLSMS